MLQSRLRLNRLRLELFRYWLSFSRRTLLVGPRGAAFSSTLGSAGQGSAGLGSTGLGSMKTGASTRCAGCSAHVPHLAENPPMPIARLAQGGAFPKRPWVTHRDGAVGGRSRRPDHRADMPSSSAVAAGAFCGARQ